MHTHICACIHFVFLKMEEPSHYYMLRLVKGYPDKKSYSYKTEENLERGGIESDTEHRYLNWTSRNYISGNIVVPHFICTLLQVQWLFEFPNVGKPH